MTIHLIAYFNNHGEVLKMFKGFFNEQTGLINIIYTQSQIFHKIQTKNGHSDINFFSQINPYIILNKPLHLVNEIIQLISQVQSVSITVIKHNSQFLQLKFLIYSMESCKLTPMRFFVKLLSNLNKNINLLTFTQHKLLILKSEFIYASLIFSCKHILKSLQSSILRDTKKSTKKENAPRKKLFSKEMQTFTFEISNNPKKRTELQTISSRKQDRGSM